MISEKIGVSIPKLIKTYINKEEQWLILEDIQNPLPKERWIADQRLLKMLFSLHHGTWKRYPELTDLFNHNGLMNGP